MELQGADVLFSPSLDYGVADGFYDLIDGLVGDIYKQASQVNRLASHSGQEHYQVGQGTTPYSSAVHTGCGAPCRRHVNNGTHCCK